MAQGFKAVIFGLDDTFFDCTGRLIQGARQRAAKALVEAGLPITVAEAFALQEEMAEKHGA